jgi:hypothetical protein
MRFFDRGHRHLHMPEVAAHHMKKPPRAYLPGEKLDLSSYRFNFRHWGYIAAKLMRPADAARAIVALVGRGVRDAVRDDRPKIAAVPEALRGFVKGLRHREPLRNGEVSRCYRENLESFATPWALARPPAVLLRELTGRGSNGAGGEGAATWDGYFAERAHLYPKASAVLDFRAG